MEKSITSRNNPLIVSLNKLKLKKYREETGLVLIEGERFVREMVARGVEFKYALYSTPPAFPLPECEKIETTPEVLAVLSNTVTPSNIVGVVSIPRREFTEPKTNFLILDHIQDPGNLGTIIRTALAFNFKFIYLYKCVDYLNDKVLRSTMGTIADVVLFDAELEDLGRLKNHEILLADMAGDEISGKSEKNIGLILGNEANGVSDEIRSLASRVVSIPMRNSVESLNVAVAGGILMSKFCK